MVAYLVTADDVCLGIEKVLEDHLHDTVKAMGWDLESSAGDLEKISAWHHVPSLDAISSADYPAGAIESPGLTTEPRITGHGTWEATWRVVVGVYTRGKDHDATASRVRRWAAAVRGTVLAHPSLDGVARTTTWVGEQYAQRSDKREARTIGGCAVSFDVIVPDAVTLPIPTPGAAPVPSVATTHTRVTVR